MKPRQHNLTVVTIKTSFLATAVLLSLGGCAVHDASQQVAKMAQSAKLAFGNTLGQQSLRDWPKDSWWQAYQDPQLDQLMQEALATAPSLALAKARLASAQGMLQQMGASERPQVSAAASLSETKVSYRYQASSPPQGWNDYGTIGLNFSYDIDFWDRNKSMVAAATSDLAATAAETAAARLILTTSVANAYAELARLYLNEDTAAAAVSVRRQTAALLKQRFDNGLENQGAVSQAQAVAASSEAELLSIRESVSLQKYAIAALLGQGPDRALSISRPTIHLTQTFGLPAHAGVGLLGHRPDITAARWRAEAAANRVGVAKAQFYPDINLSAFIGLQAFGINKLFDAGNDAGSVGPALYLPIFSGGRLEGQLTSAEANYHQAVASYQQTLADALHDVADVLTSSQALRAQIGKTREAVAAAATAHQIASDRYKGGLATYLEVLSAEDRLLSSQRALVNLQSRAFSLDLALIHALGGGYQSIQS